jgi:hypothetical protein
MGSGKGAWMQRLRKLWQDGAWNGVPGNRLTEYLLIGVYSSVAILSLIIGLTAKAGTLFGRAVDNTTFGARPEFKSIMKQFMIATADFSAGASLLVIAVVIVYWSRRGKRGEPQELASPAPQGPPFLL